MTGGVARTLPACHQRQGWTARFGRSARCPPRIVSTYGGWVRAEAVEIGLPDDDRRARLFQLYLRDLPALDPDLDLAPLVAATEGVSAAFIKELTRRAVLVAAVESGDPSTAPRVESRHLTGSLTALDGATTPIRRTLLGARRDP